ncbi:MAG: hypothetical protein AAF732_02460 [Pseudomonadota bacterium]
MSDINMPHVFGVFTFNEAPPVKTFSGHLKQIRMDRLPEDQKWLFSIACPEFNVRPLFRHELDVLRAFLTTGSKPKDDRSFKVPAHSERRFAGGYDLPRSKYYAVWDSSAGSDYGTLKAELSAYQSLIWSGPQIIDDTQCWSSSDVVPDDLMSKLPKYANHIVYLMFHSPGRPHRTIASDGRIRVNELYKNPDTQQTLAVSAWPYTIMAVEKANVFDLREQSAQLWLMRLLTEVKIFSGITEGWTREEQLFEELRFPKVLQLILGRSRGGNVVTDLIGAYLRRFGVAGMIFPSARADCLLRYEGPDVAQSFGWNFVDYEGAPPLQKHFDFFNKDSFLSAPELLGSLRWYGGKEKIGSWYIQHAELDEKRDIQAACYQLDHADDQQRAARAYDFESFRKTTKLLADRDVKSLLAHGLKVCKFEGDTYTLSVRHWQYVLDGVELENGRLKSTIDAPRIPIGLELIEIPEARNPGSWT